MTGIADKYRELTLLCLLALLSGSSYLFIKIAVIEIPPLTFLAVAWVFTVVS